MIEDNPDFHKMPLLQQILIKRVGERFVKKNLREKDIEITDDQDGRALILRPLKQAENEHIPMSAVRKENT